MLFEMTHIEHFSSTFEGNRFAEFIHFHTSHVEWFGCSLHDLIQPGFSFLVGTALAFSMVARRNRGDSFAKMFGHAAIRAVILVFLGIFLRSLGYSQTQFRFDDTLTQIGMGYIFLFLLAWLPAALQYAATVIILVGYWAVFVAYPAPTANFDYPAVGVPADWPYHLQGLASHWNKNSNAAWAFDTYWMNLFPREEPFTHFEGGYATLSFIPTLGTMLLGLFAGRWLRDLNTSTARIGRFVAAIALCAGVALVADRFGICPIVKRIWTPSWTLYSGAWCFGILLLFHLICDLGGWTAWSYPLRVVGANSIAAYVMSWTLADWIKDNLQTHFGWTIRSLDEASQQFAIGLITFTIVWLILFWMYRRSLLLRI